jgi:type II secretory pathway component PulF
MPTFRYQALNADQQPVAGEVEAAGVQQAISQLETSGLTVQAIGYASSPAAASEPPRPPARASKRPSTPLEPIAERAVLEAHLAKVLPQARSLTPALRAYAEEASGRRREQLLTVCAILDKGDASEAAAALTELPEYWIALLSSAASKNDPGRVLSEFFDESRRAVELRRQWWLVLAYPVALTLLAAVVFALLSFLAISVFRDIFLAFNLQLPALTRLVLAVSAWVTSPGAAALAVLLVVAAVFALYGNRLLPPPVSGWLADRASALLGRSTAIAQFARFTADLLDAGVEVPHALRIAGLAIRRTRLRRAGWDLANEIEAGRGARPSHSRTLTATFLHALQTEMPSSSRIRLLKEISSCYADRVRNRLSWTRGVIEPVTIGVIGVIVGGMVIGLFLPLVSLINLLSG